ncbi:ACP S-malonyltransferase [bacterium]|nr:ACP S-malonyltransferase [candidate division CSSED10-310 bacterium]
MKTAILFPGQGAQTAGMGYDVFNQFPSATSIYQAADKALGFSISSLCFNGPQEQLNLTANTQPALLVTSAALSTVLFEHVSLDVQCVAGHSLGQYTALWFAGALDLPTAVQMVRLRGQVMQSATPEGVGAMAAIMGIDSEVIEEVCCLAAGSQVLSAANFNGPGQTVISGNREAVERAVNLAKEKGARKSILLPVSAPFHCPLMQPAADKMAEALGVATVSDMKHCVICNVTARPIPNEPSAIRDALVQQVTAPVQWEKSIKSMADTGVELFVEIGPGNVLTNLAKRISPDIKRFSISNLGDIKNFIAFLSDEI